MPIYGTKYDHCSLQSRVNRCMHKGSGALAYLDFGVFLDPRLHDLGGSEGISPVDEVDNAAILCEEVCLRTSLIFTCTAAWFAYRPVFQALPQRQYAMLLMLSAALLQQASAGASMRSHVCVCEQARTHIHGAGATAACIPTVRCTSSIALSPPPMTASGFLRNMGAAPSHTAQAEMPLFQKPGLSPAPGNSSRLATAPAHASWTPLSSQLAERADWTGRQAVLGDGLL